MAANLNKYNYERTLEANDGEIKLYSSKPLDSIITAGLEKETFANNPTLVKILAALEKSIPYYLGSEVELAMTYSPYWNKGIESLSSNKLKTDETIYRAHIQKWQQIRKLVFEETEAETTICSRGGRYRTSAYFNEIQGNIILNKHEDKLFFKTPLPYATIFSSENGITTERHLVEWIEGKIMNYPLNLKGKYPDLEFNLVQSLKQIDSIYGDRIFPGQFMEDDAGTIYLVDTETVYPTAKAINEN